MGYSVYITRRPSWWEEGGPSITEQEWLARIDNDPDLTSLAWNDGNIEAKNPDRALVKKMVSVAAVLDATVQGDDGESYDAAGNPVEPPPPGLVSRIASWIRNRLSPGATPIVASSLPFEVGDRVRDFRGNLGSITEIDVKAAHGLGRITVKYDDGRILSSAAAAHGLERV